MGHSHILRAGIIGLGRSGKGIHAAQLAKMAKQYQIAAVADSIPDRLASAEQQYGCRSYTTYAEMAEREMLDLIVVASPSHSHFPIALDLLKRGIRVLCEKPLAHTAAEVDRLMEAAESSGTMLAVFQQARFMPSFVKIREVVASGMLGRLIQVDFVNSSFGRRWDWQTLQEFNGGSLANTGPHPLDQALVLFGERSEPAVTCRMERVNTFGDAEDYVKLWLTGEGSPTIDIEISSCCVYPRPKFSIQGSQGGLSGNMERLSWKYFKPEEAPVQHLIRNPPTDANGNPAYCHETLTWYEDSWELQAADGAGGMAESFYRTLYNSIVHGTPLEVTPHHVRRQMAIMEECRRQNPHIYNDWRTEDHR